MVDKLRKRFTLAGFLSVMVGVGLIAGLALVGFNMSRISEVGGNISELEKYRSATEAFHDKYGYLPGDIPAALAMQLKFMERAGTRGRGDGNGLIEGYVYTHDQVQNFVQTGEPLFFWEDLTSSSMLTNTIFDSAYDSEPGAAIVEPAGYLPNAHTGNNSSIYVYSDKSANYFGLSVVRQISPDGELLSNPGLTVREAYDIDSKIDDGLPTTGKVLARYISGGVVDSPAEIAASPETCFDKTTAKYSLSENGGAGRNCALSFVF